MSDEHRVTQGQFLARELGFLNEQEEATFQKHVEDCAECRDLWKEYSAKSETRVSPDHLSAEMIARWDRVQSQLRGLERETILRHLSECKSCRDEIEFAGYRLELEEAISAPTASSMARAKDVVGKLVAGIRGLAILHPIPVPATRAGGIGVDAGSQLGRDAGMAAYARGDFEQAAHALTGFLQVEPGDAECRLYLGSCQFLLGRPEDAVATFARVAEGEGRPAIAQEAGWQMANAYLSLGRGPDARSAFEQVVSDGGRRSGEAARQLRALEGVEGLE